jgi:hypothetical protein
LLSAFSLYVSSTGKAEFKGDDPFVNRRCIGFWIASILWFIRFFSSSVKWDNKISQQFPVTQGVRQGGILSSDLCKVYINPLLNNLSDSYLGMKMFYFIKHVYIHTICGNTILNVSSIVIIQKAVERAYII